MAVDIVEMLKESRMTKICAPMVRYSKLPFRDLVRRYACDICFTPMILADSFVQSSKARDNEFSTNKKDEPLVVQFAAKTPGDFANAAEMVAPYCNGVDLNCGCPQRWAIKEGYGVDLLSKPQLVKELVQTVRNRIPAPFTVSVKIRLLKDLPKTIDLCRTLEKSGVSFLTVHARTALMRNQPIDLFSLKAIRESIQIPVIANGGVNSLQQAKDLYESSKCQGIMVANGLLTNPALFSGATVTPLTCIQDWLNITSTIPTNFLTMHHHLVFMLEKSLPKIQRQIFNNLQTRESSLEFIHSHYGVTPQAVPESIEPIACSYQLPLRHNSKLIEQSDSGDEWEIIPSFFDEEKLTCNIDPN
ncbi:tRNA-dihydrouridine(20a/20b) synthase [NAD(P)+]-like [Fopius arisanus]|uniref:tRNA-dihydrouridine(20a/20b) synthase [NAD(P)+] n=1 Tax=Fopius arisanus TaxID=64838 RepID=A0A0C9R4H0_9HYME|nr:PREDICTED: tRNA-dihydrouridine(20a/20b) synthase [NAD(P)+]-like [Fopius arisanus]